MNLTILKPLIATKRKLILCNTPASRQFTPWNANQAAAVYKLCIVYMHVLVLQMQTVD